MASTRDDQSITAEGGTVAPLIAGVVIQRVPPHEDERGEITEVWNRIWPGLDNPVAYCALAVTRPGITRGWGMHRKQDDRLIVSHGRLRFGLYDELEDSLTCGMCNVFTVTDHHRAMIRIPRGVWHGVRIAGEFDFGDSSGE